MYHRLTVESDIDGRGTIILLPGRGGSAREMLSYYKSCSNLDYSRFIAIQPYDEWYPSPNGPQDQERAVWGLKVSVEDFDAFISQIEAEYFIDRSEIALVGFSAGSVLAIQLAAFSKKPFAAVVAHNGAILEPEDLPAAQNETPILLIHAQNDTCFEWYERYLPMKTALVNAGYTVETLEREVGGHEIHTDDIEEAAKFLADKFGYPKDWIPIEKEL